MANREPYVCCLGAATLDRSYRLHQPGVRGTSNPASAELHCGGVARNVAENLARAGVRVDLISVVGDDPAGRTVIEHTRARGVDVGAVVTAPGCVTGSYVAAVEPDGELFAGFADLDVCDALDPELVDRHWEVIAGAQALFTETNLPAGTLEHLLARCRAAGLRLFVDAVSVAKARRLPARLDGAEALFCNLAEARAMLESDADGAALARALCTRGVRAAIVTAGSAGLWCATADQCDHLGAVAVAAADTTGAGDALIAATIAGLVNGRELIAGLREAVHAAREAVRAPRLTLAREPA